MEKLEKENSDLKHIIDEEIRVHSEETEKLYKQAQTAIEKAEQLERENANIRAEYEDKLKAQNDAIANLTEQQRVVIREKNEAMKALDGHHDVITQQLIDINRKDDFVSSVECEKRNLYRNNVSLKWKMEMMTSNQTHKDDNTCKLQNECEVYQQKLDELKTMIEKMKESYQNLLTARMEENLNSTLTSKQNQFVHKDHTQDVCSHLFEKEIFAKELEKIKASIAIISEENELLWAENMNLKQKHELYYQSNCEDDYEDQCTVSESEENDYNF